MDTTPPKPPPEPPAAGSAPPAEASPPAVPQRRRRRRSGSEPARFDQFAQFAAKAQRAAAREQAARKKMEALLAADREELARRERRRAMLVGSWVFSTSAAWFGAAEQQESFRKWMAAVGSRKVDLPLFEEGADSDLLSQDVVDRLVGQVGGGTGAAGADVSDE